MLGMHGTYEANMAMQHCDVLLAIGARFDDRVIGNPKHFAQNPRKIIHIDIDPSSISKRVKVDVPIVGNVPDVLRRPAEAAARQPKPRPQSPPGGSRSRTGAPRIASSTTAGRASSSRSSCSRSCTKSPGRRLRHLRRRPAPDVGRAVLQVRRAAALDQLRRPRHHGLRPARGHGRAARESRAPPSPASPARRRSRCASRSSPPASSTACRSRSSTSTTSTWAWCASGSSSSTATATPSPTWTRCPTS